VVRSPLAGERSLHLSLISHTHSNPLPVSDFNGTAKVQLILDGETHALEVPSKETILEVALDAGLDPPYSCMAAACTSCMAKLEEGEVFMEDSDVLSDQEKADGYILCCQAQPRSERVTVRYED
jgi:ring-1,2-phenylacetyl-CoA epoxidase subunit PaaE